MLRASDWSECCQDKFEQRVEQSIKNERDEGSDEDLKTYHPNC